MGAENDAGAQQQKSLSKSIGRAERMVIDRVKGVGIVEGGRRFGD